MVENPWAGPWADSPDDFVLACDRLIVTAYNEHASRARATRVVTHLHPEPWMGRLDAPVVFLLLNPGVDPADRLISPHYQTPEYINRLRTALLDVDAPHFHLTAPQGMPGRDWWNKVFPPESRQSPRAAPHPYANAVGAIQFFPYHSERFDHAFVRVPSQLAAFERARAVLGQGSTLIVRGWRYWITAVPELADGVRSGQVIRLKGRSVRVNAHALCADNGDAADQVNKLLDEARSTWRAAAASES